MECVGHSVGIYYRSKRQSLQPNIVEIIAFFEQKKISATADFAVQPWVLLRRRGGESGV